MAPEVELEAPFTEEGIVTLDGINKQMKINHNAIMEKLESIQKRQKNEAESEAPETTYDEHDPKTSNHGSKVFKSLLTDLPVIIEMYKQIKDKNITSNEQKKRDKGIHASNMLKKIDNKKFIISLTGLVDIYAHFSVIVNEL